MVGRMLIQTLVWTMPVEVPDVVGQHGAGVRLVVDQDVVGALPPDAPDKPFGVAVRSRRPRRILTTSTFSAAKSASNEPVNLASRSRTRNLNRPARSPRSTIKLRACWVVHSPVGFAVTPRMWTRRGHHLHHHQHVNTPQGDRVEVEEIRGQQPRRLDPKERSPPGVCVPRRRTETGVAKDPPDRSQADPVAQADEVALDPSMSPARIFPSQPENQLPDLLADPRTAASVREGPMMGDQTTMPSQNSARCDQPMLAHPPRHQPGQRRQDRPVRPRQTWGTDLTPQHRHLMPKHQQFRGLRRSLREPRQPPEHLDHGQVQQPETHTRIMPATVETQAQTLCDEFWHGTGILHEYRVTCTDEFSAGAEVFVVAQAVSVTAASQRRRR